MFRKSKYCGLPVKWGFKYGMPFFSRFRAKLMEDWRLISRVRKGRMFGLNSQACAKIRDFEGILASSHEPRDSLA
jgi:hypothetical protein